jgi:hypothetical protein
MQIDFLLPDSLSHFNLHKSITGRVLQHKNQNKKQRRIEGALV